MAKKGTTKGGLFKGGEGMFGYTQNQQKAQAFGLLGTTELGTNAAKRVATDQAATVSTFGTGLRKSIKKQFVGARAGAQEQAVIAVSGRRQLAKGAETIGDIATIFKSGAQAQAAAFAVEKARALQEATGASDSQTAAFMQQLMMAKLQHSWALQEQKRAESAAMGQAGEQTAGIVQGVTTAAPTISAAVQQSYLAVKDATDEGQPVNGTAVFQMALEQGLISPESPEAAFAQRLTQQLIANGGNLEVSMEPALTGTFSGYAGFDSKMVAKSVYAGVSAQAAATRLAYIEANPGGIVEENITPAATPGAGPGDLSLSTVSQRVAASPFSRRGGAY